MPATRLPPSPRSIAERAVRRWIRWSFRSGTGRISIEMGHDVFISFAHDDLHVAEVIRTHLEGGGLRCWFAPRDIAAGANWSDAIMAAISGSAVMVLVFSSSSDRSPHVQREVAAAFDSRAPVIPVRIDGTMPSGGMKYYLHGVQWYEAGEPLDTGKLAGLHDRVVDLAEARRTIPHARNFELSTAATKTGAERTARSLSLLRRNWPNGVWLCMGGACASLLVGASWWRYAAGKGASRPEASGGESHRAPAGPMKPPLAGSAAPTWDALITGEVWENSLGMRFAKVPAARVLFCVWDTRVQDFEAFVNATGYDATNGMLSIGRDGWKARGANWKSPGFEQGPTHPVVGVSWDDAMAFCRWLTLKEQAAGLLNKDQSYRLPTDLQWSAAVEMKPETGDSPRERDGKVDAMYPWGTQWPPPAGSGNYAGAEARTHEWPPDRGTIEGYQDGFSNTSPVGSFAPNGFGLYDIGGNVWQWCMDWYDQQHEKRVVRGASWDNDAQSSLLSSFRGYDPPGARHDYYGFRCVLVVGTPQ